jgi:hypothetical protein
VQPMAPVVGNAAIFLVTVTLFIATVTLKRQR